MSLSIANSISIGDVSPRFRLPVPPAMLTADLCRIYLSVKQPPQPSMSIRCVIKTGGNSLLQVNRFDVIPFVRFRTWPGNVSINPIPASCSLIITSSTDNDEGPSHRVYWRGGRSVWNLHYSEDKKGHREPAEFACQRLLQYTNNTNGASRVYQNSRRTTCG